VQSMPIISYLISYIVTYRISYSGVLCLTTAYGFCLDALF
jgi:hypothetical protein